MPRLLGAFQWLDVPHAQGSSKFTRLILLFLLSLMLAHWIACAFYLLGEVCTRTPARLPMRMRACTGVFSHSTVGAHSICVDGSV